MTRSGVLCDACWGTGEDEDSTLEWPRKCDDCNGSGFVLDADDDDTHDDED